MEVTICIPNLNMGETIAEAIQSVINQTFKDWELFVMDGGSTDNSVEIAKGFADSRIKVLAEPTTIQERFNKVFSASKSKYLTFLASDDRFEPTFLEENIKAIQGYDFVYNSYTKNTFNDKLELLGSKPMGLSEYKDGCLDTGMFMGVFYLFTSDIYNRAGGFYATKDIAIDYLFCMQCEHAKARFTYLDKYLGWYRYWDKSDSGRASPNRFWLLGENTREYEKNRRKQLTS